MRQFKPSQNGHFLFRSVSACFGGCAAVGSAPLDISAHRLPEIGVSRLRKGKHLWRHPCTDILVYRLLNNGKCFQFQQHTQSLRIASHSALPWWGLIWNTVTSSGLPTSRKMRSYWRESSGGLRGWWGDWSICPMRKGWGSWACSAWRRLRGDLINIP